MLINLDKFSRKRGTLALGGVTTPIVRRWTHNTGIFEEASNPECIVFDGCQSFIADHYEKYGIGVWSYKSCFSSKTRVKTFPVSLTSPISDYWDTAEGEDSFSRWGRITTPSQFNGIVIAPEVYDIPTAKKAHLVNKLESRLPTIRPDIDMFVFIYELLEMLPGLISGLFAFAKSIELDPDGSIFASTYELSLEGLIAYIRRLLDDRGWLKMSWQEISKKHIEYSFVLRPLIMEVRQLHSALFDWRNRVKKLMAGESKVHDLTTSVTYELDPGTEYQYWNLSITIDGYEDICLAIDTDVRCKLAATLKYRYSFPEGIDSLLGELGVALTATGIMPNMSSAWELVPFSFVLDWILNTGSIIKSLDAQTGWDVNTVIVDACVTLRQQSVSSAFHDSSRSKTGAFGDAQADYVESDIFVRWAGEEALDVLSWWIKPPSLVAVLLGASLVGVLTS
jgi:hypothetical protein